MTDDAAQEPPLVTGELVRLPEPMPGWAIVSVAFDPRLLEGDQPPHLLVMVEGATVTDDRAADVLGLACALIRHARAVTRVPPPAKVPPR